MAALPDWQPLETVTPPDSGAGTGGRVVALVATEGASAAGWAPGAAVDLARSWAADGRRILLVDAVLNRPSLHEVAGVVNREGVSDVALYGASFARVAHPVGDTGVLVVPAGTPVADPSTVARSARWGRVTHGATEAGVTLALYLSDGESGTAAFLGSASDIVVIGNSGDEAPGSIRELEPLVRSFTGPGPSDAPAPDAPVSGGDGVSDAPMPLAGAGAGRESSGGLQRMLLLVLLAVVIAAGLGYLLSSGTG